MFSKYDKCQKNGNLYNNYSPEFFFFKEGTCIYVYFYFYISSEYFKEKGTKCIVL